MMPSSTWPGDDDAHALSAERLEDAAPYDADDLVEHLADDVPRNERVQARTPTRGRCCDSQAPNGVSDARVRIEPRTTLLANAARLLVTSSAPAVRRDKVVNLTAEAAIERLNWSHGWPWHRAAHGAILSADQCHCTSP